MSGQLVHTYQDENLSNRYVKNRATFHPTDDLILNDGVLWDTRSAVPVHKFDKFNQHINGVFHPNGQEILSNSEIVSNQWFLFVLTVGFNIKFVSVGHQNIPSLENRSRIRSGLQSITILFVSNFLLFFHFIYFSVESNLIQSEM